MSPDFSFWRAPRPALLLLQRARHQLLGFAHRQAFGDDLVRQRDLAGASTASSARAWPMSISPAISMVCTGCARFTRRSRFDTALRERPTAFAACSWVKVEFGDQARDALRFFQRIQVFALDVLDQRHRGGVLVVDFAHQHRDLVQAGQLRRAEAAFAGDDLVATPFALRADAPAPAA
jgi:hypothetical protein